MHRRSSSAALFLALLPAIVSAMLPLAARSASQDTKPYLFDVFDQFVISATAANACAAPDPSTRARHEGNFAVVTRQVRRVLVSNKYGMSVSEVDRLLAGRRSTLTEDVIREVALHGCSNPDIRQVVKRYAAQAAGRPLR